MILVSIFSSDIHFFIHSQASLSGRCKTNVRVLFLTCNRNKLDIPELILFLLQWIQIFSDKILIDDLLTAAAVKAATVVVGFNWILL